MFKYIATITLLFFSLCSYAQRENPYVYIKINDSLEFKGGEIADKALLINSQGLAISPMGNILRYKVSTEKDGKVIIHSTNEGNQFGPKEKKLFKELTKGQIFYINEIVGLTRGDALKRGVPPIKIIYNPQGKAK